MIRDSKDPSRKLPYEIKSYEVLRPLAKVLQNISRPGLLFYEVMSIKEGVEKPPFLQMTEEHLHKICNLRKVELCMDDGEDGVVFIQGRAYPDYFFHCVAPEDKRPGDIWDDLDTPYKKSETTENEHQMGNKITYGIKPYAELYHLRERMTREILPEIVFFEIMGKPKGKDRDLIHMTMEHLSDFSRRGTIDLDPDNFKNNFIVIDGLPYPDYFFFREATAKRVRVEEFEEGLELGGTEELEETKPEVTIPHQLLLGGTLGVAGARVGDRMISLLEGLGHISDFCITQDGEGEVGVVFTPDSVGATPSIYSKDGVPICWPNAERMLFFVGPGDTGRFDNRPDDSVFYKQDEKVYVTDNRGVFECRDTSSAVKAHFCEYRIMRNGNNYRVYPYGTTSWTGEFDHRLQKPKVVGHKYCWKAEDE